MNATKYKTTLKQLFGVIALLSVNLFAQTNEVQLMGELSDGYWRLTSSAILADEYIRPRVTDPDRALPLYDSLSNTTISEGETAALIERLRSSHRTRHLGGVWKVWSKVDSAFLAAYIEARGQSGLWSVMAVKPIGMDWQIVEVSQPIHAHAGSQDYQSRTSIQFNGPGLVKFAEYISAISEETRERVPEISAAVKPIVILKPSETSFMSIYFYDGVDKTRPWIVTVGADGAASQVVRKTVSNMKPSSPSYP